VRLIGKYAVVKGFNVYRNLMLLNVNKTSDWNGRYNPVTNSSLMDYQRTPEVKASG